jgi:DNA polymerase-3 subunit gamma/tau
MSNYIVSARKYRPMTFSSVVGQEALTTTLKNAVKSGKLAHAYLFCGPRGVGKTTCARIFAKAINCENPAEDGEACNQCESCKAFNEGRSMNIFELDAASNNSVDSIKTLMEQTLIPPQNGKYKVFIIDEVHMLSQAAFNAFLKTLEEPPAHVVFILATTEKHKILPTILSRCQIYDFERMTVPRIVNHLKMVAEKEGISYEEQALGVIAEKADGGMRDALSIFDQVTSFCQGNITYKGVIEDLNVLDNDYYFRMVDLALENKVSDIMLLLNQIISKGFDGSGVVQGLATHIRNVMMAKDAQTLPLLETSDEQRQRFQQQAAKCPTPFLYRALRILNECDINYRQSSNKRLLVELTLIRVAQITQPDDDSAGAGRSPKMLKTLFKHITKSPANTVPQVTGSVRTNRKPATPVGAASDAPTSTSQPAAVAAANTGQTVATAVTADSGQRAATATQQPTMVKGPHLKLSSIGMTFQSMLHPEKKKEEASPLEAPEKTSDEEATKRFTEEELALQWVQMCNRMPQKFVGLASRLKNITPHITEYPNIEAVIDNEIFLSQLNEIKRKICRTMQVTLHNDNIQLTLRLADTATAKKVFTKREVFDNLRKENPAFEKLRVTLGLELS